MKNNDKWSQLSMQQRADLIKLYTDNGITNIKDIREHYNSFGDGGETNNNENTKGYTTTNNEELQDVETFNSNWYKYRDSQLANVVKSYHSPHHITNGLNFWQTSFPMFVNDTKLASGARNYMEERLKHLKEFTLEEGVRDKQARQVLVDDYYKYFPSERKENEVEIGPPKSPDNYSLIRLQELIHKGGYSRPAHIVLYSNGYENTSTKIHERAHAAIPKSVISYHPVLNPIKNVFLQKDVKVNNYYDDIGEIYSRLMQMRFENKIDPSHKYTLEEVKAMRDNSDFKDFNIFNRYTDDSILMLLNDVAQNTTDSNQLDYINPANIAANGGKLNTFATGGPIGELEPSVVEDYTKAIEEGESAIQFVKDYYKSKAYKQRAKAAGLPTKNPLRNRKYQFRDDLTTNESYTRLRTNIGLQPSDDALYEYYDDIGNVAAHEYAHWNKFYNKRPLAKGEPSLSSPYYGNNYNKVYKFKPILDMVNPIDAHDMEMSEGYSDLIGLRYLMQKHGIFDSMNKDAVFDEETYKSLLKDSRYKNDRFLNNHSKEQVIKAINDVAFLNNNSLKNFV